MHRRRLQWALYDCANAGYSTVIHTFVFAAGTFGMDERRVLVFGIVLSLSAGVGAWLFGGLDDRLGGKRVSVLALLASGLALLATVESDAPGERRGALR